HRGRTSAAPRPGDRHRGAAGPRARQLQGHLGRRLGRHAPDRGPLHVLREGAVTAALTVVGWLDLVAAVVLAGGLLHARLVGEPSPAGRRVLGRAALALAIALPLEFGLTALRMYEVSGVSGAALVWDLLWARWGELWVLRCLGLAVLASSTRLDAALAAPWLLLRSFQGHAGAHGTVPALIDWLPLTAAAVGVRSLLQLRLRPRPLAAAVAQRVRTLA